MACFTPKNNTYCSPNVNAFLDTDMKQLEREKNVIEAFMKHNDNTNSVNSVM